MMNKNKWSITNEAKIMHCLPVRRNVELSDEMLDFEHSVVTQQASNRVWAAQTVLAEMIQSIKS
jgi:N-succinyl-L-ornithine transcarbamylase